MVESERSRRRSTSEFFLCFSRSVAASSSSSSMKLNSKSILSPGRRESSVSLSSSLSRRLRSNGSMKGGGGQASPMFPKKGGGGGGFEPPEPSSPKVTCIGQVRVKSKKKHGRKLRTRSQRRGEVSFRKNEQFQDGNGIGINHQIHHQHQHQQPPSQPQQRWVHLSLSICETLRAFGAELSCLYPCGRSSSCSWSGDREKGEKRRGRTSSSSCGAVFARWLFALQESEDKRDRDRDHGESPVQEANDEMVIERRIERREAPREIEMEGEQVEEELESRLREKQEDEILDTEEEARTSICIPPKNALLLMRSRSAPFRMSSLANRFWESPTARDEEEDRSKDEIEIHDYVSLNGKNPKETVEQEEEHRNDDSSTTNSGNQTKLDVEETKEEEMVEKWGSIESLQEPQIPTKEEEMTEPQDEEEDEGGMVEESPRNSRKGEDLEEERSSTEAFRFEDSISKVEEEEKARVVEKKEERRVSFSSSTIYLEPESEEDDVDDDGDTKGDEIETSLEQIPEKTIEEEEESTTLEPTMEDKSVTSQDLQEEEEEKSVLPECLLMMMCEPKLSMEVSKETWVCSSDFNRCRPSEKKKLVQKKIEEEDTIANASANTNTDATESKTKKMDTITESKTAHPVQPQPRRQQKKKDEFQVQPPRSSCSKVEQVLKKQSMATAVGQKLNNAGGGGAYEPFVLKRCKSEPMRRTDKLSGEACVWKKNKLETRPPELVGVGATGVGF